MRVTVNRDSFYCETTFRAYCFVESARAREIACRCVSAPHRRRAASTAFERPGKYRTERGMRRDAISKRAEFRDTDVGRGEIRVAPVANADMR